MNWYYSPNDDAQQGPVSKEELAAKLALGELQPDDLVWREGMAEWKAISLVPELSQPVAPPVGAPPLPPTPVFSNPYQAPLNPGGYKGEIVPNYLWQSIVVTVICCLPCGIPAIISASKVDVLLAVGNINAAREASRSAKKWCLISLAGFLVVFGFYVLLGIVAGAADVTAGPSGGF
jgi:hypothetical protein